MSGLTKLFMTLLEVSLGTGAVIAVLLALRPLWKKAYPARWSYWMWLVVAVRLLVPVNLSLSGAPVRVPEPEVKVDLPVVFTPWEEAGAAAGEAPQAHQVRPMPAGPASPVPKGLTPPLVAERSLVMDGWTVVALVWAVGAGAAALLTFVPYLTFRRRVRRWAVPEADEAVLARFQALKEERGVKHLALMRCPAVSSPMVTGLLRPALLLPSRRGPAMSETVRYEGETLDAVLRHELVHAKRRDLWYKLLLLLARTAHWFNPLVWLLARRADRDLELSCDEAALAGRDSGARAGYGRAILDAVEAGAGERAPLTTYFYGGKGAMLERLSAILNTDAKRRGTAVFLLVAVTAVGMAAACTLGSGSRVEGSYWSMVLPTGTQVTEENVPSLSNCWDGVFTRDGAEIGGITWKGTGPTDIQRLPQETGDLRWSWQVASTLKCELWFDGNQVSRRTAETAVESLWLGEGAGSSSPTRPRMLTYLLTDKMHWLLWDTAGGRRQLLGTADTNGIYVGGGASWAPDGSLAVVMCKGTSGGDRFAYLWETDNGLESAVVLDQSPMQHADMRPVKWNGEGMLEYVCVYEEDEGRLRSQHCLWDPKTRDTVRTEDQTVTELYRRTLSPEGEARYGIHSYAFPIPWNWTAEEGETPDEYRFLKDGVEMGTVGFARLNEGERSGRVGLTGVSTGDGTSFLHLYRCPLNAEGDALEIKLYCEGDNLLQERMMEALTVDGEPSYYLSMPQFTEPKSSYVFDDVLPAAAMYGLTGPEAQVFDAWVAECVEDHLSWYQSDGHVHRLYLPRLVRYGSYEENGKTSILYWLEDHRYYDLTTQNGFVLDRGGSWYPIRALGTYGEDGAFHLERLDRPEIGSGYHASLRAMCGPRADLVDVFLRQTEGEAEWDEMPAPGDMLRSYVEQTGVPIESVIVEPEGPVSLAEYE